MFDFEEMMVSLNELGLNVSVTPTQGKILVEVYDRLHKTPVGIAKDDSVEAAFARLVRNLVTSKHSLNVILGSDDKLSVL